MPNPILLTQELIRRLTVYDGWGKPYASLIGMINSRMSDEECKKEADCDVLLFADINQEYSIAELWQIMYN